MVIACFVAIIVFIYFNFTLLLHKKTESTRGLGVCLRTICICSESLGRDPKALLCSRLLKQPCAQVNGAAWSLHRQLHLPPQGQPMGYGRNVPVFSSTKIGWVLCWAKHAAWATCIGMGKLSKYLRQRQAQKLEMGANSTCDTRPGLLRSLATTTNGIATFGIQNGYRTLVI